MNPQTRRAIASASARDRGSAIDQYLADVGEDKRAALEQIRTAIHSLVPEAVECISYGIPTFRLDGRALVAFGAAKHHCAFYPMSSAIVEAYQRELEPYETSKGTIRFQPDHPLPLKLLRKLVFSRIAEAKGSDRHTAVSRREQ
jgi:uncharacterized protein YdhG (YjbR/CyaY superfamily)